MSDSNLPAPAVGIDLGTTFSVIAHLNQEGNPKTILNEEGDLTTPSVVFFDRDSVIVGREALRAGQFESDRLAAFAKRDIGEGKFHKPIHGKDFPPEVIQALVLRKLKEDAELRLGEIKQAVITVPAYFNEPRRKATQDAGLLAGLEVLDIINEPTAAAIAYGFQNGFIALDATAHEKETILVYDLGGGTFDVTLMEIEGRDYNTLATGGDVHLGGIDWDNRIVEHLVKAFEKEHGIDLTDVEDIQETLLLEASEAKRSLTARNQARVQIVHEGKQSRIALSRKEFESMTADLLERTRLTVRRVLKEAEVEWDSVTRLLLVGGSTRMPMVQRMLNTESGMQVDRSLSPDEAVAHGAAIYAGTFLNQPADVSKQVTISNVNSHDLGVMGRRKTGEQQRRLMIKRNTPLPASKVSRFVTGTDGQENISVRIVEGGTDSGEGANEIGKCIVDGLPDNLKAGTPIEVKFEYGTDGRLIVSATVPSIDVEAQMTIQRVSGFDDEEIEMWKQRIADGLTVPDVAPPVESGESAGNSVEDDDGGFVLDDAEDEADDDAIDFGFELDGDSPEESEKKPAPKSKKKEKKSRAENPALSNSKMNPPSREPEEKADSVPDSNEVIFDEILEAASPKEKVKTDDSDLDDFLKGLG